VRYVSEYDKHVHDTTQYLFPELFFRIMHVPSRRKPPGPCFFTRGRPHMQGGGGRGRYVPPEAKAQKVRGGVGMYPNKSEFYQGGR